MWPAPWVGLVAGWRSVERNLDLFLFLFRQHRRQHCYCLLMHYFALFSCGRQRRQMAWLASVVAEGSWHTRISRSFCSLKIHKFPVAASQITRQMCGTHATVGRGRCCTLCVLHVARCLLPVAAWVMSKVGVYGSCKLLAKWNSISQAKVVIAAATAGCKQASRQPCNPAACNLTTFAQRARRDSNLTMRNHIKPTA